MEFLLILIERYEYRFIEKAKSKEKMKIILEKLRRELAELAYSYELYEMLKKRFKKHYEKSIPECCQREMIARIEAFHKQVYVLISTLFATLNLLTPDKFSKKEISSVEQFLKGAVISINPIGQYLLEKSRDFRSTLITHPQQICICRWKILQFNNEYYVLYYDAGKELPDQLNLTTEPLAGKDYKPPFECEFSFMSPHMQGTYNAVCEVVSRSLGFEFSLQYPKVSCIVLGTFFACEEIQKEIYGRHWIRGIFREIKVKIFRIKKQLGIFAKEFHN